jgi:hypothetical protein
MRLQSSQSPSTHIFRQFYRMIASSTRDRYRETPIAPGWLLECRQIANALTEADYSSSQLAFIDLPTEQSELARTGPSRSIRILSIFPDEFRVVCR